MFHSSALFESAKELINKCVKLSAKPKTLAFKYCFLHGDSMCYYLEKMANNSLILGVEEHF